MTSLEKLTVKSILDSVVSGSRLLEDVLWDLDVRYSEEAVNRAQQLKDELVAGGLLQVHPDGTLSPVVTPDLARQAVGRAAREHNNLLAQLEKSRSHRDSLIRYALDLRVPYSQLQDETGLSRAMLDRIRVS